jgi:hypothetical protein
MSAKNPVSTAAYADRVLSAGERAWYVLYCVLTFAVAYFVKLVIKRAVLEALIAHDQLVRSAQQGEYRQQ